MDGIEIALTHGYTAIVSPEDADLAEIHWTADVRKNGAVYIAKHFRHRGIMRLHRIIMERMLGTEIPPKMDVDHIDRDTLNNRRSNLRICTREQNAANARKITNIRGTPVRSRYRGVSWNCRQQKWQAIIKGYIVNHNLGFFDNEEDAARAYNAAAIAKSGEFANLNDV